MKKDATFKWDDKVRDSPLSRQLLFFLKKVNCWPTPRVVGELKRAGGELRALARAPCGQVSPTAWFMAVSNTHAGACDKPVPGEAARCCKSANIGPSPTVFRAHLRSLLDRLLRT